MGYDDDQWDDNRRVKSKGIGCLPFMMSVILSSVMGAVIVIFSLPMLIDSGLLSLSVPAAGLEEQRRIEDQVQQGSDITKDVNGKSEQLVQVKIESDTVNAVRLAEKAVVGVVNIQQIEDFWTSTTRTVESGTGSGVIYSRKNNKALVVTNFHVIKGASNVEVSLANGQRVMGRVLGFDSMTDLAVLEIDDQHVELSAQLGSSANIQVGEPAMAIGNPLGLEFSRTVTQGIISSIDRSMPIDVNDDGQSEWDLDVIQTDAAINPGNSGGALINMAGQVIGINTLKISRAGIEGLGFAIPIDDVKPIINDIVNYGKVQRPYIGIVPRDLQQISTHHWKNTLKLPEEVISGVVVLEVVEGTARQAGLQPYDVIVALDDQAVDDSASLRKYMYTKKQLGSAVKVTFYREGQLKSSMLTLRME
jgi:serine protease Do